jgi:protein-disulfide isomerase
MTEDTITIKKDALWKYTTFVLLAVVIVGGFFVLRGGSTGAVVDTGSEQLPGETGSVKVPEVGDSPFLGPEDAEIVVIEFSDFECIWCAAASGESEEVLSQIRAARGSYDPAGPFLKELASQGKIKLVYKHAPLRGTSAVKASEASECAYEQGKFWEYHDILFKNFGQDSITDLKRYAEEIGLDVSQFNDCLDSGRMTSRITRDLNEGREAGLSGTPLFYVNDKPLQ